METTGEKKQDFILTVAKDLVLKMFLLWRGKFRGEQARYSRLPAMDWMFVFSPTPLNSCLEILTPNVMVLVLGGGAFGR